MPKLAEFDRLRIVLVATRNPLNIGAAARAMSNFGVKHLRVVNSYQVAFREARSAIGASAVLAQAEEFRTVAEAVADFTLVVGTTALRHRELHHPVKTPAEAAPIVREQLATSRVALLFGSEKRGLSNQDLSHCHWLMHVPTCEEHISMNLGQSVAVCLYELARLAEARSTERNVAMAASGDVARITEMLLDALRASGYVNPGSETLTEEKVRRLVRRLNLQARDAEVWLGMLRQMAWKLRSDS